ncbi:MAG: phosphoribosyl-ATP diphosphatase [Anaerolineae bacterium]
MSKQKPIPHQDITYRIIGAAMQVHNRIGPGHKEKVYQRDLTAEMRDGGLKVEEEYPFALIREDGKLLGYLILDHLVEDVIIVEDKALSHLLTKEEVAQVITYLAATTLPVGLLLNFGRKSLERKRILPPAKLAGWEKRIIRYLWRPDDPEAAAKHFARRGIEPKEIIVPSSSQSIRAESVNPLRRSQSADHPSVNPLRRSQSADHPSANPLRRNQSVDHILDELFAVIQDRKATMPANSYTAQLFDKGPTEIAKKVGEEAIEVIVASAEQDRAQLVYESADLIYHLLVLLAQHDIAVEELYQELAKRRR